AGVPGGPDVEALPPGRRGAGGARAGSGVGAGGRDDAPLGGGGQPVRPLVAVIGGSTCTSEEAEWAGVVGRLLAEQGAVLLCGGLGGVMEAAARGAKQGRALTVGLLPGNDPADANPFIGIPLASGIGQ